MKRVVKQFETWCFSAPFCHHWILTFSHTVMWIFSLGMFFPVLRPSYGSTDMGNVSLVTPSIHPAFSVGELEMIHTKEFQVAAGKPRADKLACRAGLIMCMTTLELLVNPSLRAHAKKEFDSTKETFVGTVLLESTQGFSHDFAGFSAYLT